jgi:Fe-S oxidoreductase
VSCKGCKRECPTGIDMARLKIEVLREQGRKRGYSLRQKLIAYLPRYAPQVSWLAPLLNLRDRIPGLPALTEKIFGLSARRTLPQWAGAEVFASSGGSRDKEVVLFIDTFSRHFEPENALAAREVLEAAGYAVHVADAGAGERPLCCGRTFLAAGMVDDAKIEARRMLAALGPFVARGVSIVGLEPSCLFSLRDEFLVMGLDAEAGALAERALLFEEFIAQEAAAGRFKPALRALEAKTALLHGHCHQKAFDAMGAVHQALALVPDLEVQTVESSCCGMAGSFGYEAEHFEASMKMAELSLLPAVRKAGADTLVVADGTSCRHQIRDGAGREALHVARVLRMALADAGR